MGSSEFGPRIKGNQNFLFVPRWRLGYEKVSVISARLNHLTPPRPFTYSGLACLREKAQARKLPGRPADRGGANSVQQTATTKGPAREEKSSQTARRNLRSARRHRCCCCYCSCRCCCCWRARVRETRARRQLSPAGIREDKSEAPKVPSLSQQLGWTGSFSRLGNLGVRAGILGHFYARVVIGQAREPSETGALSSLSLSGRVPLCSSLQALFLQRSVGEEAEKTGKKMTIGTVAIIIPPCEQERGAQV